MINQSDICCHPRQISIKIKLLLLIHLFSFIISAIVLFRDNFFFFFPFIFVISTIEYSDSLFHVSTFSASNSEEDSLNSHWLTTVSELLLSPKINCRSTRLQMFSKIDVLSQPELFFTKRKIDGKTPA